MAEPNREEILSTLAEIYREKLDGETEGLSEDALLVEDLGLDSIRLLTLVVEIEDRFQICIDEGEETAIVRVADLADVVLQKVESRTS